MDVHEAASAASINDNTCIHLLAT